MERYYHIAGLRLRVQGRDGEMYTDDAILTEYRAEPGDWDHSIWMEFCDEMPAPKGTLIFQDPSMRVYRDGSSTLTYFGAVERELSGAYLAVRREGCESWGWVCRREYSGRIYAKLVMKALELEHLLARHDTLLFHSTFIDVGGKAILFTAASGVGKSTQADLWCQHRGARLINGDRSGLQWRDGEAWACGVPFSGSSDVRHNERLPLAAIVSLAQAPSNTLTHLSGVRAFRQIWEGCTVHLWDRRDVEQATQTVTRILGRVPVYRLACTPDASAVEVLYQQMIKENIL